MQPIIIDAQNFKAGMSTDKFTADGGYSPLSKGINHFYEKGVLHFQPKPTSVTWGGGQICAGLSNEVNTTKLAFLVTSGNNFITLNSDFSTTVQATDVSGNNYTYGQTGMAWLGNWIYITSQNDVVAWFGPTPTITDFSFWHTTKGKALMISSVAHPIQAIEDTVYIGNANFINTIDSTGACVANAMTLPMGNEIIAFGAHPNGRDLVAFCTREGNTGDSRQVRNVAFIINTVTLEFSNEIVTDDMVLSARTVGGIMYVTYGTKLGYFTDTGIVFLKQLSVDYGTVQNLTYKSRTANMAGTYLMAEGNAIMGLGDIGAGKAFHYPLVDASNANKINFVLPVGQDRVFYGKDNDLLYYVDYRTDTADTDSQLFYTNRYTLPARAWVRRVEIEHTPYVTGVGLKLYSVDENDALTDQGTLSYATSGGATFSRWDMNVHTSLACIAIKAIKSAGSPIGIRKISIYYELTDEI